MKRDSEFNQLMESYLDETIGVDGMAKLNEYLLSNSDYRTTFSETLNLDSAIAAAAAGWTPQENDQQEVGTAKGKVIPFLRSPSWLAVAACAVLFVGIGWWWQSSQTIFATIAKGVGVEELTDGTGLRSGKHSIQAGSMELVTARGARVIIEAPAEFQFESAQRLRLMSGRLAAEIPPSAKGFTVITPSGNAIDLGTRFGVDVPTSGPSEIHVFEGEVIANASGTKLKQSLRGGDAVSLDKGESTARELRSSAFIQAEELAELSAGLNDGQLDRSTAAISILRKDPTLIALLDFENDKAHSGVYRTAQGRWPGSRAPEFVNIGDHLKLDVGGDHAWPQLTLAAWVRLDHLGAPYQSLLHTDGWSGNKLGQVHWMVTRHTTMRLALFGNTLVPDSIEQEKFPDSLTPVLPEQGRWIHLVTVYDSEKRTVRFYLNGQFDKETKQAIARPARLGPAQIGNWDQQDRKLSGRVDELIVLGRSMDDSEVRALYESGNPYRN